ncbi:putative nuclease HARBI1 [Calliphora vicina]|uniref:putative nuclease HARBI1 n=1 Tax=Calliphora vicina TaxID=7373 RepID=UPI00325B8323
MPGISIVAVLNDQRRQDAVEKLRRKTLRDASDPLSYSSAVFISYYRLSKDAFVMVLDKISPHLKGSEIPPIIQLSTTLRVLGTGSFQGVIAKDMDISLGRSTVSTLMWKVINAIENIICPLWIKLQMSEEEIRNSKAYFFQKFQIPGVIGCIDGTHVKLLKPSEDASLYLNRKGAFSINTLIICDYKMQVRAVDACRPGSCHDSYIWHMSRARNFFFNNYCNGNKNNWLLGDSGYGLEPYLITPYKNVVAGTTQHKFNAKHASARNIVERTIGVLKSRFRCLLGTMRYTPLKTSQIINVCCAIHNICRRYNVDCEEVITSTESEENDSQHEGEQSEREMFRVGQRIRENIATQLN